MALHIPVAHDFICPWCWIGFFQTIKLREEFGATFEWIGYELFPDELEYPEAAPKIPELVVKPPTPTRIELAYAAQGMDKPTAERPKGMRIHNAHEAVEFAKLHGKADALVEVLYRAYWERGETINDPMVIAKLATGIIEDIPGMLMAIEGRRFKAKIIGFDAPAYSTGVFHVPTFTIGKERLAEQPYVAIRAAILRLGELAAS